VQNPQNFKNLKPIENKEEKKAIISCSHQWRRKERKEKKRERKEEEKRERKKEREKREEREGEERGKRRRRERKGGPAKPRRRPVRLLLKILVLTGTAAAVQSIEITGSEHWGLLELRDQGARGGGGPGGLAWAGHRLGPLALVPRCQKSDLRNHCATVQPRLYICAMVTQITLKTPVQGGCQ
jgi:hypothetical protein